MPRPLRLIAALTLVLLAASCSAGSSTPGGESASGPDVVSNVDEALVDSVEELVAMSDAVARVEVTDEHREEPDSEGTSHRVLTATVIEQYAGESLDKIEIVTSGWDSEDRGVEVAGVPWLYPGDEVILFLDNLAGNRWVSVHSQAQYLVKDNKIVGANAGDGSLAAELSALSPDAFEAKLTEAVKAVESGQFDLDAYQAEREERIVAESFTGPVETVATGTGPRGDWSLNAAPTKDGFCWKLGYDNPAPTTCVANETVQTVLDENGGVIGLTSDDPPVVYGLTTSKEPLLKVAGDEKPLTLTAPPFSEASGVSLFVYPATGDELAAGIEVCSGEKCSAPLPGLGG